MNIEEERLKNILSEDDDNFEEVVLVEKMVKVWEKV